MTERAMDYKEDKEQIMCAAQARNMLVWKFTHMYVGIGGGIEGRMLAASLSFVA